MADSGDGDRAEESCLPLTLAEKELYHQVHPVKLAVDLAAIPLALYFFWRHQPSLAALLTIVPSALISELILRYQSFEKYRFSPLGRYVKTYLTEITLWVRAGGVLIMLAGAWFHLPILLPAGLVIALSCWLRGVILPQRG